ncbi:arabinogalactan oligomer / maltooligosaccharide transport system substrate-binding protein [Candidatus Hakubella thermalkaliphila]|nr:arabinogalactan oligomer / maltooligosaccharide transport system substrate-binding protein [Candidatus Hakubella thermalkaliphila]
MSSTTWLKLMAVGVLIAGLFSLAVACVPAPPAVPPAEEVAPPPEEEVAPKEVSLVLWTKEGEEPLEWNQALVQEYMEANPGVTIELVHKTTVEILREDFLTASLAGTPPDLLWTVNDHAGPFVAADTIEPVDGLFDLGLFVDAAVAAVELEGQHWGVPISSGNHLMLLYNKKLLAEAPKDTDELFAQGKELTGGGNWGLVWNQTEPFWLVPWLGGFKGKVFAEDGVTPTLNTPEMVATLKFLHDMKYEAKIIPPESDYDAADTLFKEGKAAMIINGDWALGSYVEVLGEDLGVARIPQVVATGEWPKPYTGGAYFMLAKGLSGEKLEAAQDFISFVVSKEKQLEMLQLLKRLPALEEALEDPLITEDPILKGSADQMVVGTPMPTVLEMRCNWDAMKPEMLAVLADTKTPEDAAKAMQSAAEACIKALE